MRTFPGKHALVVDDEPSTRTLLREALRELAMDVWEAVDGADAIHQSLNNYFDLVTMDILMPNMHGLDAIKAMRMVDPTVRIVVVSSCRDRKTNQAVHNLDVPHIVHKPVRLDEFYQAIENLMEAPDSEPVAED
jgi:CheY-like chemotaxis protein